MSFIVTSAVIGGASLLYGVGDSISKNAKANSIEKNNKRPTYEIPQEFVKNAALAKQMAQIGLPQQQYNNQQNAINRNQASGLSVIGRSANPGIGVAEVVRASNDANNNLNAQDAAARQQNQRFSINQDQVLGQQKLAQQQYNKFDKYTENFNRAQALRGAATQGFQNAVGGAAQIAGGLAMTNTAGSNPTTVSPSTDWGGMGDYRYNGNPIPSPFAVGSYNPATGWGYQAPISYGGNFNMPKRLY